MNSFQIAAQVVIPMAIMMAIGVWMRVGGVADRPTMKKVDQIVTKVFMPLLMFKNVYTADLTRLSGYGFFLYGIGGLILLFLFGILVLPKLMNDRACAAAMGQALLRPNYMLFGAVVAESIHGEANIGLVMIMGAIAIPFFNALSVILLEIGRNAAASPGKIFKSICKNTIVMAAVVALGFKLLHLTLPSMVREVVWDLSGLATPLAFLSLGVSMDLQSMMENRKTLGLGILARLVIIPILFLGCGILLGFRGVELTALVVLFATPTAVSSYPLAVSMEADGELAGQMVIFTTLCSLPTIFLWVWLLSSFALL